MSEIAHLGPVELLTPKGEESLRSFVDLMAQPWSLKLTEAAAAGMGVLGLRAWSPEALERRVAAVEAAGLGEGWVDGDRGRGPSYECERDEPPPRLRPTLKNVPGRYTGRGCSVKRLDHVNLLAADVRPNRDFTRDAHGAHGRLHHLAFWVDTREECRQSGSTPGSRSRPRRPSTRSPRGSSCTGSSPAATASR